MGNLLNYIKRQLFGYDVFISYSRNDGLNYSYSIAQHFLNKGYECYIDQLSSTSPGAKLPRNIQHAVKRSTAFVLVGTTSAQQSEPISKEIQLFLDRSKNKPIIPISIEGAINKDAIWYSSIQGLAIIEDKENHLRSETPSESVLGRIENALTFTKKSDRLRRTFFTTLIAIAIIVGFAFYFAGKKTQEANKANDARIEADNLSRIAIQERTQAITQMQSANELKNEADSLRNIAENEKVIADSLTLIAESQKYKAEKRVRELDTQSENLQIRIAANENLSIDPIIAYRLAQKAYNVIESEETRSLIMSSLSLIDYYYTTSLDGHEILDFKEPYILLINQNSLDGHPNLLVYNMQSNQINKTNIYADHAWIIPYNNSWRILTRNWNGSGIDAIAEYQLWDENDEPLSDKIQEGGLSIAQFINNHTVSIKLRSKSQLLSWDLHTNKLNYFEQKERDNFSGTYFYEIYGALDTRSDGTAAGHYNDGLVLINSNGEINESSYTQVSFDPSSFFTRAHWSPDDKFLALNYFDRKRLGVWNPSSNSFVWLDPDGWVVNSYSWSQSGHILAFSGRTENDVDVTVEILDANSPNQSRKVVYNSNIPIQSLAFSSHDRFLIICDKESRMYLLDVQTLEIIGHGHQADKVYSSSQGFYSTGIDNFKSWSNVSSPSKHWFFKSDSTRTYSPKGAVDPSSNWIAVPYYESKDKSSGIELRQVLSGKTKYISYPNGYVHEISFSNDGEWLILETSDLIHFWNTTSWEYYDFPLINEDRQFISLETKPKSVVATLAEDSSGFEIDYIFDLNSKPSFIQRKVSNRKSSEKYESKTNEPDIAHLVDGWVIDKPYQYRAMGWTTSNGWAIRLACRDNPLGASDCDVQFIPTDINWLMDLFDNLVWSPTDEQLESILKTD